MSGGFFNLVNRKTVSKTLSTVASLSLGACLAMTVGRAHAAPINYSQDLSAGTVAGSAAELTVSGTPVNIDGTGTNYPDVYEAGDFFDAAFVSNATGDGSVPGGAGSTDNWLGGWARSTPRNTLFFFDTGSSLDTADGTTIQVDFTIGRYSSRAIDDGNYLVQLFDGLSDVTNNGGNFTANDTPLASSTVTIDDSSFYNQFYNGIDSSAGLVRDVSLTFTGLGGTTNNLYLLITVNSDVGSNEIGLVDNVSLSQVPEPASLALLGLGGVLMLGRRVRV